MFENYDYIEGSNFDALMPHAIDTAPSTVGKSSASVHFFEADARGPVQMELADIMSFYSEGMNNGKLPKGKKNTAAQQATADNIVKEIDAAEGKKAVVVEVPEGETINNVTIPANARTGSGVKGVIANGATITSTSKLAYVRVENTSEEPVDINLNIAGNASLCGKFRNVYLTGRGLYSNPSSGSDAKCAEISGKVTLAPTVESSIPVKADFQDGAIVWTKAKNALTVTNVNEAASMEIYAPYATVSLNQDFNELVTTVSKDTLIVKSSSHVNKLIAKQGNVIVMATSDEKIGDYVGEYVLSKGVTISHNVKHVTNANYTKVNADGEYILDEDIEGNAGITIPIIPSYNIALNLNGHTLKCGNEKTGNIFVRSGNLDILGDGKIINNADSYGIWVGNEKSTLNVYGGYFEAYTHVLYAEKGTINVYGGTFKILNEYKNYLLNCYDASYKDGTAKINVYGGKFYEFDPSNSMSEPNGPVSFVAEGYHVVESEEDGVMVYEVVKDE